MVNKKKEKETPTSCDEVGPHFLGLSDGYKIIPFLFVKMAILTESNGDVSA